MRLNKLASLLAVVVLVLIMLPLTVWAAAGIATDQTAPPAQTDNPNLLTNPGMEGKYVKQCSLRNGAPWVQVPCPANYDAEAGTIKQWETTQVPYGWSAWWRQPNNNFDDPNYYTTWPAYCPDRESTPADCIAHHNPEYRDTLGGPQETGPSRKVAGDNSQKYFTFYSIHEAGLYQVVSGVKPGERLRFSVFMEAWSTGGNDPRHSDPNQHMNLQVGIDPTGGNNPWSPSIIWTAPAESFDTFTQFVIEAVAQNSTVSVWTKSKPELALQHVDVYVDEASLTVAQPTRSAPSTSSRVYTSTKIITSTKIVTSSAGITSTVIVTESIVVTSTRPSTTGKVNAPTSSKITSTLTSRGSVTSTKIAMTPVFTGTLPATYTVVRGDTLIAIARRFNISPWMKLVELNRLKPPYRVTVGQVLKLK